MTAISDRNANNAEPPSLLVNPSLTSRARQRTAKIVVFALPPGGT